MNRTILILGTLLLVSATIRFHHPAGRYTIRVTAVGFKNGERTGITTEVDQHAQLISRCKMGP